MRKTIYLPDDLAALVDEYLENHRDETFSSLVQHSLQDRIGPKDRPSILRLAGLVDVDTFESEEKSIEFANRPEDQFYDRVR